MPTLAIVGESLRYRSAPLRSVSLCFIVFRVFGLVPIRCRFFYCIPSRFKPHCSIRFHSAPFHSQFPSFHSDPFHVVFSIPIHFPLLSIPIFVWFFLAIKEQKYVRKISELLFRGIQGTETVIGAAVGYTPFMIRQRPCFPIYHRRGGCIHRSFVCLACCFVWV